MSLVEAWRTNARLTLLALEALAPKQLKARYSERTRTVASQFAHVHNVRVMNLERRGGPDADAGLAKFERGAEPTKTELKRALKASGAAMERLFEEVEASGKVRSWRGRPPATWLGYHCAHEAHHRALAIVCLRFSGERIPDELKYGLWDGWRKPPA